MAHQEGDGFPPVRGQRWVENGIEGGIAVPGPRVGIGPVFEQPRGELEMTRHDGQVERGALPASHAWKSDSIRSRMGTPERAIAPN